MVPKDELGNPVIPTDSSGNLILPKDQNGNYVIPVLPDGKPIVEVDEKGAPIPARQAPRQFCSTHLSLRRHRLLRVRPRRQQVGKRPIRRLPGKNFSACV